MTSHFAPEGIAGFDLFLVLGIGAAVIVLSAALAARWLPATSAHAAIWRIATAAIAMLLIMELTGVGQALVQIGRMRFGGNEAVLRTEMTTRATPPGSAPSTTASRSTTTATVAAANAHSLPIPRDVTSSISASDGTDNSAAAGESHIAASVASPAEPLAKGTSPSSWWLAIWAAGTCVLSCRIAGGRIAAGWFRRSCSRVGDSRLFNRINVLKTRFAIRRPVRVLASPHVVSPMVLSGWRPALVLPVNFARDFDRQQQDTILAHELAHLAARDAAWQAAAFIVCAVLWWHPLVWFSRRQLRAAQENLADEASLVVPDGPRVLAEALVALGQRLLTPEPRFGLSLGGGQGGSKQFRSGLGRRVERLLNLPSRPWRSPRRARMAFVHFALPAVLAIAAIFGTAWAPSQAPISPPESKGETTMNVLTNSWRASLMATALCSMLGGSPNNASADDGAAPTPPPLADQDKDKIKEKFRAIRERAAQLDKEGKHEDADRLRKEVSEAMKKYSSKGDYARSTANNPDVTKIRLRAKEMFDKASQLEKDGKHDDAEHLRNAAQELYKTTMPHNSSATPSTAPSPERIALYERMNAIKGEMENATREGNEDRLQHLTEEMQALQAKLRAQEPTAAGHYSTGSGDRAARIQHLRQAAENLMAAGCKPEYQHVMEMIEHMEAESRGDSPRIHPDSTAGILVVGTQDLSPAVQELRAQIEQMHREMREMREELERTRGGDSR